MRAVAIVLAEASPVRLRTALTLALATRALGGAARIFLDAAAVPLAAVADDRPAAGLPTLGELREEAFAAGVELVLCQTGLAAAALEAADLDPRFGYGGLPGFLAALTEDERLLAL